MGGIETAMLFVAKYILPLAAAIGGWLYRELKQENKEMKTHLDNLKDRVSSLDSQKISYEQCMALLDKQEQRIVERLNSMDGKLDKLFDRITSR